ncbi:MAG: hypothetical protein HY754_03920 [Nitrospirae bacterium]|nr:hypothetical protein [Nitrospirota bacterium]
MSTAIRDKHLKLDQKKIDMARKILGAKTETETIEKAMEVLIQNDRALTVKRQVVERILSRRKRLKMQGDAAEPVRIGREEREKALWSRVK